jgi:hypothetical protein
MTRNAEFDAASANTTKASGQVTKRAQRLLLSAKANALASPR